MTTRLKIATWNVNSIRARLDRVITWLTENSVDVLLLQETKVKDEDFPVLPFLTAGYEVVTNGTSQWNGVAIASRVGLEEVEKQFPEQPGFSKDPSAVPPVVEARALFAKCGGVEVASLYIPNGRSLTDPHYAYKIAWLHKLAEDIKQKNYQNASRLAVYGGDWNIAPLDEDVWDPEFFRDKTHTSPAERAAFQQVLQAGLVDSVRRFTTEEVKYTYWDYTQLRFPRNQGMRIDFLLTTKSLDKKVVVAYIDRKCRYGKGASDHVPVIIEVELQF